MRVIPSNLTDVEDQRFFVVLVYRVSRGAAVLDVVEPGWAAQMDPEKLAMESLTFDMMGQIYGDYLTGFQDLTRKLPAGWIYSAASFGFTLYAHEQDWNDEAELEKVKFWFGVLGDLWKQVIRERLAAPVDSAAGD